MVDLPSAEHVAFVAVCVLAAIVGFVYKFPTSEANRKQAIDKYVNRVNLTRLSLKQEEIKKRPEYDSMTHWVKPLAVLLILTSLLTASTGIMHHERAQTLQDS